jgi:hypothetical protein
LTLRLGRELTVCTNPRPHTHAPGRRFKFKIWFKYLEKSITTVTLQVCPGNTGAATAREHRNSQMTAGIHSSVNIVDGLGITILI